MSSCRYRQLARGRLRLLENVVPFLLKNIKHGLLSCGYTGIKQDVYSEYIPWTNPNAEARNRRATTTFVSPTVRLRLTYGQHYKSNNVNY